MPRFTLELCVTLVCFFYGLTLFISELNASTEFDPYLTLGLSRSASEKDIRKAYKLLARKWHPDKNKNPKSQEMFMKVTDAYNILSNEERRYKYDTFGMTKDQPTEHHPNGFNSPFGFHSSDAHWMPFSDSFFGNMDNRNIQVLTNYIYDKTLLPMSYKIPQLIYIYGDWCFQCMQLEMIWESAAKDLKSIGVGVYELNFQYSRTLNSKLGVGQYPQFLAVFEGRVVKYTADEFSNERLRLFVRKLIPRGVVKEINRDSYLDFFRQSFLANKPQAILFSNKVNVPLLFNLIAYQYRNQLAFAYVNSQSSSSDGLRTRYGIGKGEQLFLILKEEPSSPEVILKGSGLNQKAIREAISENSFFHLPRISSQEVFDSICPVSTDYFRKYCVVLFTISSQDHSYQRYILRKLAKDEQWKARNVKFMFINEDVQRYFKLNDGNIERPCENGEQALKLLILRRLTAEQIQYDWLDGGWCQDESNDSVKTLTELLSQLIDKEIELSKDGVILSIIDEHQPHIFYRIKSQVETMVDHLIDSYQFFSWSSPTSLVINAVFIGVIFLVGILLPLTGRSSPKKEDEIDYTVLGITKLTAQNSRELINNSPPGSFTVVLLLDVENISQVEDSPIMQAFSDATYSFVRGGLITFAWLSIQEQLSWCAEVMDIREFGKVLPGTVIAVNGRKKYVHVFRPKGNIDDERIADFIGLESESEMDEDEFDARARRNKKIAVQSIKNFLSTWLERLCDGTLAGRVQVDNWPMLEQ